MRCFQSHRLLVQMHLVRALKQREIKGKHISMQIRNLNILSSYLETTSKFLVSTRRHGRHVGGT